MHPPHAYYSIHDKKKQENQLAIATDRYVIEMYHFLYCDFITHLYFNAERQEQKTKHNRLLCASFQFSCRKVGQWEGIDI